MNGLDTLLVDVVPSLDPSRGSFCDSDNLEGRCIALRADSFDLPAASLAPAIPGGSWSRNPPNLDTFNWDIPKPFAQTVTVGPEHLDAFGHTNNVVYLAWLQDMAWAHSLSLGIGRDDFYRIGAGCVARRHELDYLATTRMGDVLHVATWIAENAGRPDMWRAYQIIRAHDGKTVLRGRTQWICVDMKSGRPRRQPPEFVAAYRPLSRAR